MVKNVQKCLRLNHEIYKVVDSYEGAGFNQKFERMVLDFKETLPERERQKAQWEKEIKERREELQRIREAIDKASVIKAAIDKALTALDV